ncbi:hypothetical protein FQR65_LT19866 [Abscondita terminalis]|nr:hypothetical protein FQR65_LT19866 [Abscondita terminalis]
MAYFGFVIIHEGDNSDSDTIAVVPTTWVFNSGKNCRWSHKKFLEKLRSNLKSEPGPQWNTFPCTLKKPELLHMHEEGTKLEKVYENLTDTEAEERYFCEETQIPKLRRMGVGHLLPIAPTSLVCNQLLSQAIVQKASVQENQVQQISYNVDQTP